MRRYSFSDLVHPEDIGTLLRTSAEGGRAELRLARRDGTYVWVSLRNSVVADTTDGPRFLLTHVEDIEERKRHELQLAHRASHDSLTGLPNSAELRARLGARLCSRPPGSMADAYASSGVIHTDPRDAHGFRPDGKEPFDGLDGFEGGLPAPFDHHVHLVAPADGPADDGSKGLAVLFCDLDGFKSINDRFGHNTGDAVLIEVARRLTSGVRDGDTVARLGGDEFVVLADGLGTADAAGPRGPAAERDHPADPGGGPGGPGGRQLRHRLGELRDDGRGSAGVGRPADVRREALPLEGEPAGGGLSHGRVAATAGPGAAYLTPDPLRPPHQQFTDP